MDGAKGGGEVTNLFICSDMELKKLNISSATGSQLTSEHSARVDMKRNRGKISSKTPPKQGI